MRTFFEGVEELLDHDPEYQETKEKQDALSEEIDEKIDEHYEKWHEIDRLQERQAEIENEIDSIKSKAFNEKIEQKIDELACGDEIFNTIKHFKCFFNYGFKPVIFKVKF